MEVGARDAYLGHVLDVHLADIRTFQPSYAVPSGRRRDRRWAFLVQREAETVGAVVVRDEGDGSAVVELDYVTPRFRDCTPGEFVYEHSGVFAPTGCAGSSPAPELATHAGVPAPASASATKPGAWCATSPPRRDERRTRPGNPAWAPARKPGTCRGPWQNPVSVRHPAPDSACRLGA